MSTHKRQSLFFLASGLVLVYFLLGLIVHSTAKADVGVHPVLPGGSDIQPDAQTPIQMSAEVVTMNVRSATKADNTILQLNPQAYGLQIQPVWYTAVAEVQAVFTMTNPTSDVVSLTSWFPLASALESVSWNLNPNEIVPSIASFHVSVDGNPEDYSVIKLPNPKGADKPLLPWASFPVTFSTGVPTIIHVRYLLPLTQAIKGSELALYYVFQTGAGWAGSIGKAELILNLPYPASEETLLRIPSSKLGIPYPMAYPESGIPFEGVMQANQARWTWTNFEPGPQDDFAIWLMDPTLWNQLGAARAAVQARPDDGQAWLNLASIYDTLSTRGNFRPSIFSTSYLPLGIEAYKKVIQLWPEHPTPHIGLVLLTLTQYMTNLNAPAEVMSFVYDQLNIAKDLEAKHPELAQAGGVSSRFGDDALSYYFNSITATANFAASSTYLANQTDTAVFLLTPTQTPTPKPSLTPTTLPSPTPQPPSPTPASTLVVEPENMLATGETVIIVVVLVILLLVIVVSLVMKRARDKVS